MSRVPFRAYAVKDGEDFASWWVTTDNHLFTRTDGLRESVLIEELTWVGHGLADQGLYGLFGDRKKLFTKNCM